MIFSDAIRSLKDDFSRTFFYFLTFFITTMFMFLFFNMAASEMAVNQDIIFQGQADVSTYLKGGDIANIMMIFVLVMSCIDILFANSFFIKNKAAELAVRLVCGATFTQLAFYLLIQTFSLLLVAIPLGILCGYALIPVMNGILATYLESAFVISISGTAIAQFVAVILLIVGWTTTLNLSYAYQNEAAKILNGDGEDTDKQGSLLGNLYAKIPNIVRVLFGIFCFLYPLYAFYTVSDGMAMYAILGMLGLDMVVQFIVIPWITSRIRRVEMKKPVYAAYFGFLRDDFMKMRITVYLFIAGAILLMAMLVMRMDNPIAVLMVIVTYVVMNFLQAMTIMFRLQTVLSSRNGEFRVLSQIGFEENTEKRIIRKEILGFFGSILFVTLLYMVNIFISLVLQHTVSSSFSVAMTLVMIAPLLLASVICFVYYRKVAFLQEGEGQQV